MGKKLTAEGLEKLSSERVYLLERIADLREVTKEALKQGNIDENTEYLIARNDIDRFEIRIHAIDDTISNAEIVDDDKEDGKASIGDCVKVHFNDTNSEEDYVLCCSAEADPMNSKISIESPIGKLIYKSCVGDEFTVNSVDGDYIIKIMGIESK